MGVAAQYKAEREAVEQAAQAAGRPGEVRLVAVSKTVGLREVEEALGAGATDFGENRPDQLMEKADRFPQARWHFIGNIQSRRIKDIVGRAALIHSLFEERHAQRIDQIAAERGLVQDVLLEVNVSGEASKAGLTPQDAASMLESCENMSHLRVCGLMTMAPQGDQAAARATFRGLASLRDQLRATLPAPRAQEFCELSMGMSEDWPIAIQEGATLVRIGRAIFQEGF